MKLTSQMWSAVCFTPTFCPANLTQIDLAPLIADAPAARDHGGPVMKRVVEVVETPIGARGGGIAARRRGHVEGLVRPLLVVAMHEGVEAHLLLEHIRRGGPGGLGLQR